MNVISLRSEDINVIYKTPVHSLKLPQFTLVTSVNFKNGYGESKPHKTSYHIILLFFFWTFCKLSDYDSDEPAKASTLVRLHGTFMVLAWILSASLGHVIARYFKRTWMIWRVYKYDVWFVVWIKFKTPRLVIFNSIICIQIHVSCMSFVWLFTLLGFLMILIDLKTVISSWHNIIGFIIVLITVVHPLAAIFGPDIDSKYYKRFYLGHLVVGSFLHLLASKNYLYW